MSHALLPAFTLAWRLDVAETIGSVAGEVVAGGGAGSARRRSGRRLTSVAPRERQRAGDAAGWRQVPPLVSQDTDRRIQEQAQRPYAPRDAAHGLTRDQAERLVGQLAAAGFTDVLVETRRSRRQMLLVVRGSVTAAATRAA